MTDSYNSATVTTAEAEQMARMREAHKAQHQLKQQVETAAILHNQISNKTAGYASTVGGVLQHRPSEMTVNTPNPDPRVVYINGMGTSRENYEYLRSTNSLPPGAVIHDPFSNGDGSTEVANPTTEKAATPKDAKPEDGDGMTEAEKAAAAVSDKVFADGQTALDAARRGIGEEAVSVALAAAAESGDLTAPQGVSSGAVHSVVQAYTASAETMIAGSGIDIATLSEVLDGPSLAAARSAVVAGDTVKMQHIANQAFNNLLALERDAGAFEAFMDEHYDDIGWDRHPNGTVTIDVEGHGPMPWQSVVRLGGISAKTRVSRRK